MNEVDKKQNNGLDYRNLLAVGITALSILGVITLAIVVIRSKAEDARTVLTAILPLLASWVGTILAYYFSKDNFEAATRSVTEFAKQLSPQEKLQSIPVRDQMIPKSKMFYKNTPANAIKLVETLNEVDKSKKGNRIPVLGDKDYPVYMIHRSMIDKYLSEKARSGVSAADLANLTLEDLLNGDPELKKLFETSFATVKEDATLADAKIAMEKTPNCQDIFVTRGGGRDEEIIGWITNGIIEKNSKV